MLVEAFLGGWAHYCLDDLHLWLISPLSFKAGRKIGNLTYVMGSPGKVVEEACASVSWCR